MGQASTQDIPEKQAEKQKWTMRRLVSGLAPIKDVFKAFKVFDTAGGVCSLLWVLDAIFILIVKSEVPWFVPVMMMFSGLLHLAEKEMKDRQERFLLVNKSK